MNITLKLKNLLFPQGNCESVAIQICRQLKVPVTKSSIRKQLEEHPDFPSLLSVSETLSSFGVENLATKLSVEQICKLPAPMIVQLAIEHDKYFAVVTSISENNVSYIHPKTLQVVNTSKTEFQYNFTGYILMVEAGENAGEKEYKINVLEEFRKVFSTIASAFVLPLFTLLSCMLVFTSVGISSLPAVVYTLLTLAGALVSTLLLWYDVDQHNPALQQICSAGKKTNCNAILTSSASKVFGISWSVVGFTYFAGSLISLLVSNIYHLPVLSALAWLNVFALPYILFSLYYQAKIAGEWCVLCLTVQAILALQCIVSIWGGFHSIKHLTNLSITGEFAIILSFILPFLGVSLLLPALRSAKENRKNRTELQRLKHNTQIFEALLHKQKSISDPNGLGISIGNPNSKNKLVKVCNPYCGPCAKAHPDIEELVHNNPDVHVQILFTATGEEDDYKSAPCAHLLAIAEKGDEMTTRQALDNWYLAKEKSYTAFALKYPMNGELKKQSEKMKAMDEWCRKSNIEFTPTFFLNGHQLPKIYSVADLKYFLSV